MLSSKRGDVARLLIRVDFAFSKNFITIFIPFAYPNSKAISGLTSNSAATLAAALRHQTRLRRRSRMAAKGELAPKTAARVRWSFGFKDGKRMCLCLAPSTPHAT